MKQLIRLFLQLLCSLCLAAGLHGTSSAATRTCTTTGSWQDPTIWSGGIIPTSIDNVIIRGGAIVTVDGQSADCLDLTLSGSGSVDAGALVVTANTKSILTVHGDAFMGTSADAAIISMSGGKFIFDGDLNNTNSIWLISGGEIVYGGISAPRLIADLPYHDLRTVTGGTWFCHDDITVNGTFTEDGDFDLGGLHLHAKGGVYIFGTITASGAAYMDGGGDQVWSSVGTTSLGYLVISGGGTKTYSGVINASLGVEIQPGATFAADPLDPNAALFLGQAMIGDGTYVPGSGKVTFNGSSPGWIEGSLVFNDLTIGGTSSILVNGSFTVTGTFRIIAGATLDSDTSTLHIQGPWFAPGTFLPGTAKVHIDGIGLQSIPPGVGFSSLFLGGSGTKAAQESFGVAKSLTIGPGTTLDAGGPYTDTVGGDWTNSGTFLPRAGTIILKSPSSQHLSEAGSFQNLTFSGAGNKILDADLTVLGDLTINAAATVDAGSHAIVLKGNWNCTGSFLAGTGSVTINGGAQTIDASSDFHDLTLGGAGAKTALSQLTVDGTLALKGSATFEPGTWKHVLRGDWTTVNPFHAPGSNVQFQGTQRQTLDGGFFIDTLRVNNPKGIRFTAAGPDTILGSLQFLSGPIVLDSSNMMLGNSCTITGSGPGKCFVTRNGHGVVKRIPGGAGAGSFLFPVAPDSLTYNPVTITLEQVPSQPSESFTASVSTLGPASPGFAGLDTSRYVKRVWTLSEQTPGGNTADLTFQWKNGEDGSQSGIQLGNPVSAAAYLYSAQSGSYSILGDVTGPAPAGDPIVGGTVGFTSSAFGPTIVGATLPLPVTFASFHGALLPEGAGVDLVWTTLSEINNYGFTVERSSGGDTVFTELPGSFVPGHGTTTEPHEYSYRDTTVHQGTWRYRIRQQDTSGSLHFSDPLIITLEPTSVAVETPHACGLSQNYPNPFNPTTTIRYTIHDRQSTSLKVYDLLGRVVATLVDGMMEAGEHNAAFDARTLASGVYIYRLQAGSLTETKRMILLR